MSTKNLSRTIIEGGRSTHNKFERRESHRTARRAQNIECHKLTIDPELFEEDPEVEVETDKVYKAFDDKLQPLENWIHSKIGRNWNKVYSEIRAKFDVRTTPGRHVIEDHLLVDVSGPNVKGRSRSWFRDNGTKYITNAQGVLKKNKGYGYRRRYYPKTAFFKNVEQFNRLVNFYGSRIVGRNEKGAYFWFVATSGRKYRLVRPEHRYWYYGQTPQFGHQVVDKDGNPLTRLVEESQWVYKGEPRKVMVERPVYEAPRWRQDRKLTKQEIDYFESLPETIQNDLLKLSPLWREEKKAA